ncbi:uncharacterized protein EDB93DRAFT_1248377 [Suillus bovinus]|uniref:uncharacterized protein n=1 Tax=Suillus bovinus TaxID=48563 RepID=UPI001B875A00|nr:uncharacterized protein EDB93DRAFT_1248377 [Suillus bovinus]KAG2154170.1 hypothetical protein EDB93DRAFT_1248377 [Suillus bovinus]
MIQQSMNAAQRKSSIDPPPAIAVPDWTNAIMGPPPVPRRHAVTGPDVAIPTSWQGSAASLIPLRLTGAVGYSSHHGLYGRERLRWAKAAYATPGAVLAAETILLKISAVHEVGIRNPEAYQLEYGLPYYTNICEGKKDIDAPGLISLTLETVLPKLCAFGGMFSWRNEEFIVRDSGWPGRKGPKGAIKGPTFKTKQFTLMVVVPEHQWNEFEDWQDNETHQGQSSTGTTHSRKHRIPFLQLMKHSRKSASVTFPSSNSQNTATSIALPSSNSEQITSAGGAAPSYSAQCTSPSASGTISPPHKLRVPLALSPDCNDLREALKIGGGTDLNVKQISKFQNENIHFHSIPTRPLHKLPRCTHYHSFSVDNTNSSVGYATIDPSIEGRIGIGGFKTAHQGWLTLTVPPSSGLGSRASHNIVVKHPFHRIYPQGIPTSSTNYRIGHFALVDELPTLFREANVLYWAKVLLGLVYDFINCAIAGTPDPPPFNIPCVQFVEVGLTLSYSQGFLLEEVIDGEDFTKFIHNMDLNLLLDPEQDGYDFVQFLAFTQHVQYTKMGGVVFISDYQGSTELLTDPQIMMHSSVSEGKDIFREGNIEKACQ